MQQVFQCTFEPFSVSPRWVSSELAFGPEVALKTEIDDYFEVSEIRCGQLKRWKMPV